MKSVICSSCKTANTYIDRVGFRAECEKCGNDLHVCLNCNFHDPKVYNECIEPTADPIQRKDRANLCEHFTAKIQTSDGLSEKDKLRAAADALFKKKCSIVLM